MDDNTNALDPRLRDSIANLYTPQQQQQQQQVNSLQTPLAPNTRPPATSYAIGQSPNFLHTPPAGGDGSQQGGDDANDPKRSRACEACRGLKVRCEPDINNPEGPCKRCTKANRNCVITAPSRKRQKKTDSRVAELEKKINALTATLQAQGAGSAVATAVAAQGVDNGMQSQSPHNPYQQVTNGGYGSPYNTSGPSPNTRPNEWLYPRSAEVDKAVTAPPMVVAGQKRKFDQHSAASESPRSASTGMQKQAQEVIGFFHTANSEPQKPAPTHEYADIIDRGLTTAETAAEIFNHYVKNMAPHMPAVVFPAGTTAAEIRKTKPILFLAILGAGAGSLYPDLQRTLTKEVMSTYAERVICNGDKTIELVQALIISCLWYWPPEHFEELKFYQLIHVASVMAIDIGMNKKNKMQKTKAAGLFRDNPWRRTPFPDAEGLESRRTWLACYFLCCNASMGLRRPNLIRWTPFMAECIGVLETSSEALPSDKSFCQWIRSQHIAEDIGTQFSMDDPSATVSISDPKVQYALKGFEIELEKWVSQIPPEANSPSLQVTEHVVNLYMHEVAMHVDHNVEEFKPPFTDALLRDAPANSEQITLTGSHIAALSICLKSIDGIFGNFLQFNVDVIRCLPVASFVRVAYAVVVLIKMYFAAATPGSHFGKVIDKDNMKVEQYLDGLVDLFRKSAKDEKSRPSAKFLMVLLMLKTWFHRQREEKGNNSNDAGPSSAPGDQSANAPNHNANGQRPQSSYSPSNTPLQLLSEVATGNSGGQSRSGSMSNFAGSNEWQQMQYGGYGSMAQPSLDQGYAGLIDPNLVGMDFGYSMGDGLEQAMGMTLGVGEYGNFYGENGFFGSLMGDIGDSLGGQGGNFEGNM
ncbi:related to cercosporin resistance protein [Rhynchosporium graminicola]|uniref:Related to cercosporin resistance protein n=1 Tax=Rhynchosporium graminicola TaxID=2792576 RepID=A0A1E1KYP0_9HELO|nr:related to cercosporin resistance protein [Rhynchosporium commune]